MGSAEGDVRRVAWRTRLRPWLRDLAIALVVLGAIRAYQQRSLIDGRAPELSAVDVAGAPVALADYRGAPMVLHFWATWCGVCKAEQSNIDALARKDPVLTVASQSGTTDEVTAYAKAHGVVPRVVVDERGVLAKRFGVSAFPTTFVLDGHGNIRSAEVGYTTELGLRARLWWAGR